MTPKQHKLCGKLELIEDAIRGILSKLENNVVPGTPAFVLISRLVEAEMRVNTAKLSIIENDDTTS